MTSSFYSCLLTFRLLSFLVVIWFLSPLSWSDTTDAAGEDRSNTATIEKYTGLHVNEANKRMVS